MYSMWNAPSDLDYYEQANPEPPAEEPEPELLGPEDPFEVPLIGTLAVEALPPRKPVQTARRPIYCPWCGEDAFDRHISHSACAAQARMEEEEQ
jgi:hypothetical protein